MPGVFVHVAKLLGAPIHGLRGCPGVFRILTREDFQRRTHHVHVDRNGLSCILCLNEVHEGDAATSFYVHRRTGLIGLHDRRAIRRAATAARVNERTLLSQIEADGSDMSAWDRRCEVSYRFNRLIVFDTDLFHKAGDGFGSGPGDARLTMNFNVVPYVAWRVDRRLLLGAPFGPSPAS